MALMVMAGRAMGSFQAYPKVEAVACSWRLVESLEWLGGRLLAGVKNHQLRGKDKM